MPIITILKKGKKQKEYSAIIYKRSTAPHGQGTGSTSVHRPSYWLTYNHSKHSWATHSQRYNTHSLSITSPWQYKNYLPGPLTGLETYHNTSVNNALVRLCQISLDNWKNGIKHYYIIMLFPVLIFEPVTQTKRNFGFKSYPILESNALDLCILQNHQNHSLIPYISRIYNVQMMKMR